MDKQTFFSELSDRLSGLDVRNDYIDKHIAQFDSYFSGKTDEQVEEEIEKLGDLDRLASRIKRMTDKMILAETGIPPAEEENAEDENVSGNQAGEDGEQDQAGNGDGQEIAETPREPKAKPHRRKIWESEIDESELDEIEDYSDEFPENRDGMEEDEADLASAPSIGGKQLRISRKTDDDLKSNLTKFRIIFFLCLPLVAVLLVLTAALFGILFFAIAVLVIIASAALAAITAAGSAVSIFGLISGIVQALSNLSVGIYECGLSIMIGAAALFAGILVYNFVVRLMPFVASKLWIFMKFVFRKFRVLYVFVKKECLQL